MPIVTPLMAVILIKIGLEFQVLFITFFSLIIGGIPYILMSIVLLWISFKKTLVQFKFLLKISPLILGLSILPVIVIWDLFVEGSNLGSILSFWFILFVYILLFGYFYVFGAFLLAHIGIKMGFIKPING